MAKRLSLVSLFRALEDPTRLRILNLVADQEVCVCYFVEVLDAPQSKISRHLAYLRKTGLVDARRDGKWIHYRLALPQDEAARKVLTATLESLRDDKSMQRDRARLTNACCGPKSLVQILGAPAPVAVG